MAERSLDTLRAEVEAGPPYSQALLESLSSDSRAGGRMLHARCLRRMATAKAEAARAVGMLAFERQARQNGFQRIAGVDEAGRGPLAGPIAAAAVVLNEQGIPKGIKDSKQLTASQREEAFEALYGGGHAIGAVIIGAEQIDAMGIHQANLAAMRQALEALSEAPDYALIDGYAVSGLACPSERIVKGDARSASIAAASIVAKVTRDRLMDEYDKQWPVYGFARHKGYATAEHLEALRVHGPCPIHRRSFAPLRTRSETAALL